MAVAEFHAVVIPAGGSVLNGFLNHQVELPGLGSVEVRVHFKDRGDFDQCEGNGVHSVFLLVLLDEQFRGFGRKARRGDLDVHHLL